jgi:hypothetical protein
MSFWDNAHNGTEKVQKTKHQFVLKQLTVMTSRYTPELPRCEMKGRDAEWLAGVLAQ